ncbi:MAG: hypothetical protein KC457_11730 [Myxococcales bacterium]|nr:hypothetical protein [Myxococcales bacterium]
MAREISVMDYLRKAFTWRWNLLVFGGATAAALLSPFPDIALLVVAAGELAYLGGMTASPKFRAAVEAELHKEAKGLAQGAQGGQAASGADRLQALLSTLGRPRAQRFIALRRRCLEMTELAAGVRGQGSAGAGDKLHTQSIERMLWVFVRLLASQQALERFLQATDGDDMQTKVGDLERKVAEAKDRGDDKILRALVDSLATAQLRLDNLQKATRNAEFVDIELDRIEDKIKALVEMAVSHEDPDFISNQVDSVAESISHTEQAMREMTMLSNIDDDFEQGAPAILDAQLS